VSDNERLPTSTRLLQTADGGHSWSEASVPGSDRDPLYSLEAFADVLCSFGRGQVRVGGRSCCQIPLTSRKRSSVKEANPIELNTDLAEGQWRRGRDLNPGKACTFNSFQVWMISGCGRPLRSAQDQKSPPQPRICPWTSIAVRRHCCQIAVNPPHDNRHKRFECLDN
jgi:hypothetical protein